MSGRSWNVTSAKKMRRRFRPGNESRSFCGKARRSTTFKPRPHRAGSDRRTLLRAMAGIYARVQGCRGIRTNVRTAEMIKYASNALFATLISFSNEIGNFCAVAAGRGRRRRHERPSFSTGESRTTAADGSRVVPALTSYLKAGCGFGGSCFPKDVRALIEWGSRPRPPGACVERCSGNKRKAARRGACGC